MSRAARTTLICVLLVAAVWGVYGQVRHFELVDFDDLSYVTDNPHVNSGATVENVRWVFTHAYDGYWAPLTWVSYMIDTSLFASSSGAYHLTNVALHAATSCLVFAVFFGMTRRPWLSAIVAALFAVHPLHVESVAWVAERKDVLSGFFWFLTIGLYMRYVRRPGRSRYALVLVSFACGLMAKPIVVTLPFVLLLLDVWPLGRFPTSATRPQPSGRRQLKVARNRRVESGPAAGDAPFSGKRLLLEKVPLLALSAAMAVITVSTQSRAGAVPTVSAISVTTRVANALVSMAVYPVQMVWPTGLAAIYPYPDAPPLKEAALAFVALAVMTLLVLRAWRRARFLLVGWLWYLITLLPVLGLIQAGPQARADRYTYLSMTGVAIMVVWSLARIIERRPATARAIAVPVCLVLSLYAALAWRQVEYWRDGETLFRRALSVTSGNYVAHAALGSVLATEGRFDESIAAYAEAIRTAPAFAEAYAGLGRALLADDQPEAAAVALTEAVRLAPADTVSLSSLGSALARTGRLDEAAAAYREAIRLAPDKAVSRSGLGLVLSRQGRLDDAVREFNEALRIAPSSAAIHYSFAMVLAQRGRMNEALPHFREAARLDPSDAAHHIQLGNSLAMQGDTDGAIEELRIGSRLKPDDPEVHSNLGIVLADRGRLDEAIAEIREAIRLSPDRQELRSNLEYLEARRRDAEKRQR